MITKIYIINLCMLTSLCAMDPTWSAQKFTLLAIHGLSDPKTDTGPNGKLKAAMIDILRSKDIEIGSMPAESSYAVIFDGMSKLVGFMGCYGNKERVEIDKFYLKDRETPDTREVVRLLLTFALEKHPQAKSMYTPLQKGSTLIPAFQEYGFEISSYLDINHDREMYNGWECSPETFYLSNIDL